MISPTLFLPISCPPPPPTVDVSLELEQLREERNRLDAELQLSAHIIQQEVGRAREQGTPGPGVTVGCTGGERREELGSRAWRGRVCHPFPGEAERQQLSEVAQQLERELQRTQESLASVGLQLEAARQGQQESTEEAASLRQELTQQQELYGQGVREGKRGASEGGRDHAPHLPHTPLCTFTPALQEKVAEVETRLREQLSETERRLSEARREHAKAGEVCGVDVGFAGEVRRQGHFKKLL